MNKKLLKLPLQFFGEDGGGDKDNDFTDDFFDDGSDYYDTDEFDDDEDPDDDADADLDVDDGADDGADNATDNSADNGADNGADDSADDGADDDADDGEKHDKATSSSTASGPPSPLEKADDLISELRALGYVGNDLAALTADMKAKREAQEAQDAKREAAATKAAGKNHIRSGKPGKSASGDGTGGVNERRVISFAESAGVSKERAREMLAKHARLIEGK